MFDATCAACGKHHLIFKARSAASTTPSTVPSYVMSAGAGRSSCGAHAAPSQPERFSPLP